MHVYILCDFSKVDDEKEAKIKAQYPEISEAFARLIDNNEVLRASLISHYSDDSFIEDDQLGFSFHVKQAKHLNSPIDFCNELAQEKHLDFEIGSIDGEQFDPVSYFGFEEGKGDSFMLGQYLGL